VEKLATGIPVPHFRAAEFGETPQYDELKFWKIRVPDSA
jgi:hypothetical protein